MIVVLAALLYGLATPYGYDGGAVAIASHEPLPLHAGADLVENVERPIDSR